MWYHILSLFSSNFFECDDTVLFAEKEERLYSLSFCCCFLPNAIVLLHGIQVSWIRHRDTSLLTVGRYTYTTDQRFESFHLRGSQAGFIFHQLAELYLVLKNIFNYKGFILAFKRAASPTYFKSWLMGHRFWIALKSFITTIEISSSVHYFLFKFAPYQPRFRTGLSGREKSQQKIVMW